MPAKVRTTRRYCPVCRHDLTDVDASPCPGCQRPFDPDDESTTSPCPVAYCLGCGYDFTGLDADACPECGTDYDALDPSTFSEVSPRRRKARKLATYVLLLIAAGLLLFILVRETVLPRPAWRFDGTIAWSVWLWFDRPYGVETLAPAPNARRVHYWAGQAIRVTGDAPASSVTNAPALQTGAKRVFEVERIEEGFRMRVLEPGVDWRDLLLAFNTIRDPDMIMGVSIQGGDRERNAEPFEARGDAQDLLQALIDVYELDITPGITHDDLDTVWMLDEQRQLIRVDADIAREMGYRLRLITPRSIMRMSPRLE